MDETPYTYEHRTHLLDLPDEILLDIFDCSEARFPVHDPSSYYNFYDGGARLRRLGTLRLVCREIYRLISPRLCPVVSVSLCSQSIERLEGLSRNPLIAKGIRGIEICLLFRPKAIAANFERYREYAYSVLDEFSRECDWHTEFEDYAEDDTCKEAVIWREYQEVWSLIRNLRYVWGQNFDSTGSPRHGLETTAMPEKTDTEDLETSAEKSRRALEEARDIRRSFQMYAAAHEDQACIVSNGSFMDAVVGALSRCSSPPFIWFNENHLGRSGDNYRARDIEANPEGLSSKLTGGHDWLTIEDTLCKDDDDTGLFFPASILTELPIACHNASVPLRGISVNCFPLLRGYQCLLPEARKTPNSGDPGLWTAFAAACHGLEIFTFGARGMNCSPIRPQRQSTSDSEIINGFIAAAISGPCLQKLEVNLHPFRVRNGVSGQHELEHFYHASPMLAAITSTQLRSIVLNSVDISEQDLLGLVKSASPQHLTRLYLSSVTLSHGCYASAMALLHKIVCSRTEINSSKPEISFNTLQGAEFGEPSTFDGNDDAYMYGSKEERDAFWERLEEHQHPQPLQQVQQWIADGCAQDINPLLTIRK